MLWHSTHITPEDVATLEAYTLSCQGASAQPLAQAYSAKQARKGVRRDILLLNSHGQRLGLRLEANSGELVLTKSMDSTTVVENLRGVSCYMQEELYYILPDKREAIQNAHGAWVARESSASTADTLLALPTRGAKPMQKVRTFQSETAQYSYHSQNLTAENVQLMNFAAKGHQLDDAMAMPYARTASSLRATAKSAAFSLEDNQLKFTAQGLKANIVPSRE